METGSNIVRITDKNNLHGRYILLEDGTVRPEPNLLIWADWMEEGKRHVKKSRFGRYRISTVFLGLDHSFGGDTQPLLFETLVCGGRIDGEILRYHTREEAVAGHDRIAKAAKNAWHSELDMWMHRILGAACVIAMIFIFWRS